MKKLYYVCYIEVLNGEHTVKLVAENLNKDEARVLCLRKSRQTGKRYYFNTMKKQ